MSYLLEIKYLLVFTHFCLRVFLELGMCFTFCNISEL